MATQTKELARLSEDFRALSDGREISSYFAKDGEESTFTDTYYKGVWLVDRLGQPYFYPTSEDIDIMVAEIGIVPDYEGTRTLVLLPDSRGRLTERASKLGGRGRLTGYKSPVISQDFTVHGYEKKDELDHLEINPDTLRPYPELNGAIRMLGGQPGMLYIQGWNKSLPIAFGNQPDSQFRNDRVWIDPRVNHEFGERPLVRDGLFSGPLEWRFDAYLNRYPSDSDWGFRLGRVGNSVRVDKATPNRVFAHLKRISDKEVRELLDALKQK